jgi:glycosyltransferase involved in cell wall biosynthesis
MILGINALGTRGGGCETVLRSLLDGISESTACRRMISRVVVFVLPRKSYRFDYPCSGDLDVVECPAVTDNAISRYGWLRTASWKFFGAHGCDLLLNMSGVAGRLNLPQVSMLQNSLYFCPEAIASYHRRGVPWRLRARNMVEVPLARSFFRRTCRDASRIIVQSEVMKAWVERDVIATRGRVHVVRPAIPDLTDAVTPAAESPAAMRTIRGRRLLYIGNDQPYKNLVVLFEAASLALRDRREWTFLLTLSAPPRDVPPNVVFLGALGRSQVAAALREADALVMPSLVETVGLPMVESLSLGTPVIAADRPYAREFCGNAAEYFDPHDAGSLCAAIDRIAVRDGAGGRNSLVMPPLPRPVAFAEEMVNHCLGAAGVRLPESAVVHGRAA